MTDEQRQRLADAFRAKARPAPPPPAPPTRRAVSRDPCPFCAVPGFKGCEHFLPCEPPPPGRAFNGIEPGKRRVGELERRYRGGQYGMGKWR